MAWNSGSNKDTTVKYSTLESEHLPDSAEKGTTTEYHHEDWLAWANIRRRRQRNCSSIPWATLVLHAAIAAITSGAIFAAFFLGESMGRMDHQQKDPSPATVTAPSAAAAAAAAASSLKPTLPDCGESVDEARANGCVFDPMLNVWLPSACHFPHITEEFLAANETWWYDEEHTRVLPQTELRKGELAYYYPQDDHHLRHCLYTWRKLSWAYETGQSVDKDSASYEHGGHCVKWLTPGSTGHKTPKSTRSFTVCTEMGSSR